MNIWTFFFLCLGLVLGAALGVGFYMLRLKRQAEEKMRLPGKWPLTTRVLMTTEEYEVFKWLFVTFEDHLVMIKLPVLRFTVPLKKNENGGGARWQELLAGVYCTFTVCTPDGHVVGCVDVPGKRGLNKNNRQIKEALLSDCGIAYTVVRNASLPEGRAIRTAFLGEIPLEDQIADEATRAGDSSFYEELTDFKEKQLAAKEAALTALNSIDSSLSSPAPLAAGFNSDGTGAIGSDKPAKIDNKWENSFIRPDDSRPVKLD